MTKDSKICVVGLGYIGLPTASLLATKGYNVLGVDINPETVDTINRGAIHIVEPDLDILVKSAVHSGNLKAALKPAPADVFILAVPTPFKEDHRPDLSCIEAATTAVAPLINPGNLVILESTSPAGATEQMADWLASQRPDLNVAQRGEKEPGRHQVFIAHCPERVLPGQILKELVENDRIIGGVNSASSQVAQAFYKTFGQQDFTL